MKPINLVPLVAGLVLLLSHPVASGQTAIWTGNALTTVQDWNDASLWDTGVAPNSPSGVAVINNAAVASTFPGGGIQISSATVDLAELRFGTTVASGPDTWAQRVLVTAPYALPPVGSTLNLRGAGITTTNSTGADPRYIVSVGMGSQLHFYNQAGISGAHVSIGFEGANSGFSGSVDFHDQSSAGSASIYLHGSGVGSVAFHDQSSAATATIETDSLTFADQSSADSASIITYAYGSTILFKDQASAGNANIGLTRYGGVVFADQANAGTATVSCSLESSGVVVRDQADVSGLTVASMVYSGSTAMGGSLDITNAAAGVTVRGINGGIMVKLGANTLTLGPATGDQTLGGAITGEGGLVLNTGRKVSVTRADNTYTGPTIVRSGSLDLVNGRISATTVAAAARLTGIGAVAGNLANSGTILPGSSVGTIAVSGNFSQTSTGVLGIEILSPTNFDQLTVSGTATLGGTLNLSGSAGIGPVGSATLKFLSAGALSGRFDTVTIAPSLLSSLGAARTGQLVYSATGASYQVTQSAFAGFGGSSPAATALGVHLDANLAGATGEFRNLLGGLNGLPTSADVGAALEALAPDRYSVLAENAFTTASARRAATDRRLAATRSAASHDSAWFFEAGTRAAVFNATGAFAETRSRLDRGTVGGVWRNDALSLGAALTHETGSVDLDQSGSTDDLRSLTPEIFAQYDSGHLFMNASIARSGDNHDLRRRIVYPGHDQTATASVSGSRLDVALTAGCTFTEGDWTITPVAGLLSSRFKVDDFVESGAAGANLAVSGWTNRSFRSHAGMEATRTVGKFTPHLAVRWLHEFKDDRSLEARFADTAGTSYSASGRPAETDLAEVSISVSARLSKRAVGYLTLGSAWGRRSHLTSDLTAGGSWQF